MRVMDALSLALKDMYDIDMPPSYFDLPLEGGSLTPTMHENVEKRLLNQYVDMIWQDYYGWQYEDPVETEEDGPGLLSFREDLYGKKPQTYYDLVDWIIDRATDNRLEPEDFLIKYERQNKYYWLRSFLIDMSAHLDGTPYHDEVKIRINEPVQIDKLDGILSQYFFVEFNEDFHDENDQEDLAQIERNKITVKVIKDNIEEGDTLINLGNSIFDYQNIKFEKSFFDYVFEEGRLAGLRIMQARNGRVDCIYLEPGDSMTRIMQMMNTVNSKNQLEHAQRYCHDLALDYSRKVDKT